MRPKLNVECCNPYVTAPVSLRYDRILNNTLCRNLNFKPLGASYPTNRHAPYPIPNTTQNHHISCHHLPSAYSSQILTPPSCHSGLYLKTRSLLQPIYQILQRRLIAGNPKVSLRTIPSYFECPHLLFKVSVGYKQRRPVYVLLNRRVRRTKVIST